MRKEIITRKTLDLLLKHIGESSTPMEDLKLITYAINDYEREGYNLNVYKKYVDELKKGYWKKYDRRN